MPTNPAAPRLPGVVTIAAGPFTLDVAPQVGGSIARFAGLWDGRPIDWLRPASAEAIADRNPLGMASFPLIPYCNRIRDGHFTFDGVEVTLPQNYAASRHAIHGDAWRRPWTVASHGDSTLSLAFEHEPAAWPFAYSAAQVFELSEAGLQVTLAVTNRGDRPMPLGLGHHPYWPRTPETTITATVDAIWSADEEVMPTALERSWVCERLATGLRVSDADLDNNFTGWDRTATVRWPERNAAMRMVADAPLDFMVAYTPSAYDFFCLEPVSNCTDWPNLTHLGREKVGGMVLAPGESTQAAFRLEPCRP
ncbi:aldose 1-epimerase [Azospirillum thermophilum]|uniref:Aldose 1-epimerase n=1 Tax=Azospirillum thermophilum TaxID=2202148 RepID=A0A2S2CW75_9PROT|nr:aldose 1-epimerase [Azospirillum thermophilum]AWK88752.1 aldose 1-epimerase [Azospirillum thermophilum]